MTNYLVKCKVESLKFKYGRNHIVKGEELYIDTRSVLAKNFSIKFAGEKEQSSDNLGHTYVSWAGR